MNLIPLISGFCGSINVGFRHYVNPWVSLSNKLRYENSQSFITNQTLFGGASGVIFVGYPMLQDVHPSYEWGKPRCNIGGHPATWGCPFVEYPTWAAAIHNRYNGSLYFLHYNVIVSPTLVIGNMTYQFYP